MERKWAVRHEAEGTAVYEMLLDLSGMYVKSAQILASKVRTFRPCILVILPFGSLSDAVDTYSIISS